METGSGHRARYSVARRLFYSHLLIALLVAMLVGAYFYLSTQNEIARAQRAILQQSATTVADRLPISLLDSLHTAEDQSMPAYAQLRNVVENLVQRDPRLYRVDVVRRLERGFAAVVSSDAKVRPGDHLPLPPYFALSFPRENVAVDINAFGSVEALHALAPVGQSDGQYGVVVELVRHPIEETLATLRRNAGLAFVLAVVLALAVSQWLARATRRVIAAFVNYSGELAAGRYDRRLELTGDEEFVRLGTAFNDLAGRLKVTLGERESALSQARVARDQLENNVRERTRELERLNTLLRGEAEQRSRLEAALAEAAATDPMTQLLNRRAMLELIEHVVERLRRQGRFFCLLVLDIDFFKRINDHYGHSMGDQVLTAVAHLLKSELKSDEAAARWGGEEFLLLWPDIGLNAAEMRANRIRELLASKALVQGGPVVTISVGIAEYTGLESVDSCLIKADRALYRAKDEGRNRVMVAL